MIIICERHATEAQMSTVEKAVKDAGLSVHRSDGVDHTVLGVVGDRSRLDMRTFRVMPGVKDVVAVSTPYKLASREFHEEDSVIFVGDVPIGGAEIIIMAGPCAVESGDQIRDTAREVAKNGARILRGGAFKPRTSPYSFQGLGEEGLKLMKKAADEFGLAVVTEVMSPEQIDVVSEYADMLQVGARNMQNFRLLTLLGESGKPVLLKRGLSATIEDWLMSAEYILAAGNEKVVLCERGIRTFETATRNTLDLSAVPVVKQLSHLPIIVDPSHGVGDRRFVAPMARGAVAVGADGVMVEVHPDPPHALSDGPQSLTFDRLPLLRIGVALSAPHWGGASQKACTMPEEKIAIIGCGLIGGSICQALKRKRPGSRVVALDREECVPAIRDAGVAHEIGAFSQMETHLKGASIVILATPVEVILEIMGKIAPFLEPGTVVSDVGSTKMQIMGRAREVFPDRVHFVGGHPIAGSEQSGVLASDPLLFKERAYVLCPFPDTPPSALLTMLDVVDDLLGVPVTLDPEEHDRVIAIISHVPQLLAIGLVHAALTDDATHGLLELLAGKGFLDLTRVAASEYSVWRGILETNRESILAALSRLEQSLGMIRDGMNNGELEGIWESVGKKRRGMSLMSLTRLRKPDLRLLVDRWDEQILRALGNRLRVVDKIGTLKRSKNAQVCDPERERRLLSERCKWAKSLAIPDELVEELFSVIMKHSKKLQSRQ